MNLLLLMNLVFAMSVIDQEITRLKSWKQAPITPGGLTNTIDDAGDPNDNTEGIFAFKDLPMFFPVRKLAVNLDIGGGQFDTITHFLANQNVRNLVYDPYNRTPKHNIQVLMSCKSHPVDSVTIMSVLNVINEPREQIHVLELAKQVLKPKGRVFIKIWEGNRSGIKSEENEKFQWNSKTANYLKLVRTVFPRASLSAVPHLIIA